MSTIKKHVTTKIWPSTLARLKLLALLRGSQMCPTLDDLVTQELAKEPMLESGK